MKKKKKNLLHKSERDILRLLNKSVSPISVNKIAEELEIAYTTAKKYTSSLVKKKLIKKYIE